MQSPSLGDRSLFERVTDVAYLNHAAVSPISSPVEAAITAMAQTYGAGLSGAIEAMPLRDRLREKLGRFVGAPPDAIGFVQSTTTGINHVALSLPWRAGDRVVLFEGEFPANVTPWQRAAALFEVEIDWVPVQPFHRSLDEGLAALDRCLDERTRIVAVSLVQFQSGLRMPVEAIAERCHRANAEILVDGIQGMGVLPFDVSQAGVDYLACGGHKWMMGVEGAGFVYVRPSSSEKLVPRTAGWTSPRGWLAVSLRGSRSPSLRSGLQEECVVVRGRIAKRVGLRGASTPRFPCSKRWASLRSTRTSSVTTTRWNPTWSTGVFVACGMSKQGAVHFVSSLRPGSMWWACLGAFANVESPWPFPMATFDSLRTGRIVRTRKCRLSWPLSTTSSGEASPLR